MVNKYFVALVVLFSLSLYTQAQTISPDIITTTGDYYSSSAGSLSVTLGEPVTETYSSPGSILTQGFQQTFNITITALNGINSWENVTVYPNPAVNFIYIRSDTNGLLQAELIDLTGKVILKEIITRGQQQIDISALANSIYFLRVYNTDNQSESTFKIDKTN